MPNKKTKKGKERLDKYYHLAKEQGFRARSAFKLIQLNKKFDFLSTARVLVDLCAAPGGWCQVASKYMPVSSKIIGIDLVPIKPIRNVITLVDDITTQKCRLDLKREINGMPVDVVLHDGAPNVGASWLKDAYTQSELVLCALKLAVEFLRPGGTFVSKVFRSQDYNSLMWVFQQLFRKVEATKPPSSRNVSAEIFVVCRGYKAPAKIDPKMLDPTFVFAEVQGADSAMEAKLPFERTKPSRDGYEENNYTLFRSLPVSQFVESASPVQLVAQYNAFTFDDDASKLYAEHALTSNEIRELCADLKLVSKRDFKVLMRWREKMVKFRDSLAAEAEGSDTDEAMDEDVVPVRDDDVDSDDDLAIDRKLEELNEKKELHDRKQRKKERAKATKIKERLGGYLSKLEGTLDTYQEQGLFNLDQIKSAAALVDLADGADDVDEDYESDDEEVLQGRTAAASARSARAVRDDDVDRYLDMEAEFDAMYDDYLSRRKVRERKAADSRAAAGIVDDLHALLPSEKPKVDSDDDDSIDGADGNPLLIEDVSRKRAETSKRAKMWFSQPMFADLPQDADVVAPGKRAGNDDDEDEEAEDRERDGVMAAKGKASSKTNGKANGKASSASASSASSASGSAKSAGLPGVGKRGRAAERAVSADADSDDDMPVKLRVREDDAVDSDSDSDSDDDGAPANTAAARANKEKFEEVPRIPDELYDTDEREEILALGTLMLRKKEREAMIDDSYNRYAFDDLDGAPRWFADDERAHSKRHKPITKEMVKQIRERFAALNARPIKKVAEAKARKKMRAARQVSKLKKAATGVIENQEMKATEKMRKLQSLVAKTGGRAKPGKIIVATKGKNAKFASGVRTKVVDKRFKSDMRGQKRAEARKRGRTKARHKRR